MSAVIREAELDVWFTRRPGAVHTQAVEFRGKRKDVEIFDFLGDDLCHYSGSFGTQWSKYRHVQVDRFNGTQASYAHLKMFTLGDLHVLEGKVILEIGSGAGRFTDYLVDLGKAVITVDPSSIDVNVALGASNLIPIRADLFDVPVRRHNVDVVFCRGVTQHTANTRRAIMRLFDYVKPGGIVLFDVYHLRWFTPFCLKYWIRPFTRSIPVDEFIPFAEKWVPRLLQFKRRYVVPFMPNNTFGVNLASQIVPVADYTHASSLDSWTKKIEWSVLDTVDMYTPRYDRPMTWNGVLKALHDVGAQNIEGDRSSFCFRANAPA